MNKQQVMINAWNIAKEAAKKFGGKAIEYISGALKMAWQEAKQGKGLEALEEKGYNHWTNYGYDRYYLNLYKHEDMLTDWGEKFDGEELTSSEQAFLQGLSIYVDAKTLKIGSKDYVHNKAQRRYADKVIAAIEKDLQELGVK